MTIFNRYKKREAISYIEKLFDRDKKVKIEPVRRMRSVSQNRLYWLWIACLEHETGNSKEDLHSYFKQRYIEPMNKIVFGETIEMRPSTKDLDTKYFTLYLDKIQQFAATDLKITLPNPSDRDFDEFLNFYSDLI
jgi:hypothetical protein